ncbi:MAG: hypothetical protein L0Y60_00235 [Beijerinckiaceae bacterium]|nr:hypothetical protein [Beijerinckiaceae bacterium]
MAARERDSPEARAALERLCRTYWYPVYAYLRMRGSKREEAQDLAQEFFLRLLDRDFLRDVAREKGRFRTFLLASLKNFLVTDWERRQAVKRGGRQQFVSWDELDAEERYAQEPVSNRTPEDLYDQGWAVKVMEQALDNLRAEFASGGKQPQFERLQAFLSNPATGEDYAKAAQELAMTTQAVAVAVHRMRRRFGELARSVVAHTVAAPDAIELELQALIQALAQPKFEL